MIRVNKQQREFKRQMQESLMEVKKQDKEKYYDYIKWNNLEDVESRRKREFKEKVVNIISSPFKLIIRIVFIIFIFSSVFGIFTRLFMPNNGLGSSNAKMSYNVGSAVTSEQKSIINYFNRIKPVQENINELIEKRNADNKNYKKGDISKNQYRDNLLIYQNKVNNNLNNLKGIECPDNIINYKNLLIEQYTVLNNLFTNEISYYNSGDNSYKDAVNKNVSEYNSKNKETNVEFNNIKDIYNLN